MNHEQDLQRVVLFFESMTEDSVLQLSQMYAPQAYFKDAFNEVCGLHRIEAIFSDMFQRVESPRFFIDASAVQGEDAFLAWRFRFRMKRFVAGEQCIRGSTHLRFNDGGFVVYHRDYWDAAEELYESLPVIGRLMRLLRTAGTAPEPQAR